MSEFCHYVIIVLKYTQVERLDIEDMRDFLDKWIEKDLTNDLLCIN